ncbi:MAG: hypothetical protein IPJ65_04010 [Archangiaceae bacterium]|nr:hypothetical protein [Archangiaceae bacterium]
MFALVAAALLAASPDAGAAPAPASAGAVHPQGGADFTAEAKLLYRIVACQGDLPLPANIDAKVVEEHCKKLKARIDKYRKTWVEVASPFIQKLKPEGLPTTVVYPFGGGDLISALTTYPELTEVTTMSLEHAGDPRRIHKVDAKQLRESLDVIDRTSAGLLVANDSKTENLMKAQRGELPGQLSFFLIALAVHGYEPVSLRYIALDKDGSVKGHTAEEIAAVEGKEGKLLRAGWTAPDFSEAFDNYEMVFVKIGGDPKKDQKVHRHFARNLDDDHVGADEPLQKYLEARGRICAMTKAASYLLWRDNFSRIRNFLLAHMEFMVSDSTGVPPAYATKAGFEQVPFGHFSESFLGANAAHNADFKKLWAKAPPLEFRYGYLDKGMQFHMLITKKAPGAAPEKKN